MKITDISVVRVTLPHHETKTPQRRPSWNVEAEVANPMSRYAKVKAHRSLWLPRWEGAWVKVTAEDGTWGLGTLNFASALAPVVEHLASQLVGEDCLATEKAADMMFRMTKAYGTTGLASYAISGLDDQHVAVVVGRHASLLAGDRQRQVVAHRGVIGDPPGPDRRAVVVSAVPVAGGAAVTGAGVAEAGQQLRDAPILGANFGPVPALHRRAQRVADGAGDQTSVDSVQHILRHGFSCLSALTHSPPSLRSSPLAV